MARSSGRAGTGDFQEKFEKGEFSHAPSGVRYRVHRDGDNTRFDFEFTDGEIRIHGSRRLEYFVGSGAVGRSYLLSVDNFLYQAPVAYYSPQQRWELSPGYQERDRLYLTRPVGLKCLGCHASRLQPTRGTLNGFAAVPFLEGGIGCETCHGAGEAHIGKLGAGPIVNPRKLPPERRDSVCSQCHLTGVARIERAGRGPGSFRPGDLLSDHLSVFVWAGATAEMKVTSHFEKLAQSRCKIESGTRLWCGSCHDPHALPPEADKVSYFRGKCLKCHASETPCKETPELRARNSNDCASCHMPKSPVTDVAHAVYTDHSIPRRIVEPARGRPAGNALTVFGGATASERDFGLAYALLFETERNPAYEARAFELLKAAVDEGSNDSAAIAQLGHSYGHRGDEEKAIALYERAVRADPGQVVAASNLATYLLRMGRSDEAIELWSGALAQSPAFEAARMNLAVAQFRTGNEKAARETLKRGLELNPGSKAARALLLEIQTKSSNPVVSPEPTPATHVNPKDALLRWRQHVQEK